MIDATMKIKCVAPWAGGKRTLAPRIVELLGEHTHYYEPFVGGCSILPQKPRCVVECVNDLNPKVVNVLICLRDFPAAVHAALADTPFGREAWECANAELAQAGYVGARVAAAQLVAWWMGPNGTAGTTVKGWFAQRHTNTGGSPEVRWESFVASVPALAERVKSARITHQDFRGLLGRMPDEAGVAAYLDPPYFTKEFQYEQDFKPQDHTDLAAILNGYRHARIVVSYRDEIEGGLLGGGSLLDQLYPPEKWRRVEVEMSKNMASASGTARRNVEVLLVNDKAKGGAL